MADSPDPRTCALRRVGLDSLIASEDVTRVLRLVREQHLQDAVLHALRDSRLAERTVDEFRRATEENKRIREAFARGTSTSTEARP